MNFSKIILVLCLTFTPQIFAQGEAAIPFLLLPTSPKMNAAGAAGTASLSNDPYSFYFNPAHLGYSSRYMNISSGFYPGKIEWLPIFNVDITLNSSVFNAGYNFEKIIPWLPLSAGFGYSKSEINYGRFAMTGPDSPEILGYFDSKDYYSAYSFGIGYHSIVNVSAGITFKDVYSKLGGTPTAEEIKKTSAEVTAIDYGFLINFPLNNLFSEPLNFDIGSYSSILTDINYSLGYTIQNIGDEVYYMDKSQSDPIGRTARLAHNLQIGASLKTPELILSLVNFSYSIDAEDLLIKKRYNGSYVETDYQGLMGDIKFGRNLLLGKGNPEVVLHKGMMIEFFELLTFAEGGFSGRGFDNRKTDGVGFRLKGILKLINLAAKSETVKFITDHFDVEYFNTNYFSGHEFESEFSGMMITVGGF